MRTLEYVNECLKTMGNLDTFGTKKEIKELPNILHDDEELLYLTSGFLDGNTWLISCTNERIIFLDKGMIYGLKQKEIPLDKINSVEHSKGLMFGKITVWDGAAQFTIENIQKTALDPMINTINKAIKDFKNRNNNNNFVNNGNDNNSDDLVSKLERLAKLKEQGIISEEEFQKGKDKILNS